MSVMGRDADTSRRDRGAAAVEFALLLPVVLLVIFGIIDFGRMLNAQITINQAAREGARAAALIDKPAGEARVAEASQTLGTVEPSVDACPANPEPDDDATADVTYDFHFITPIGFMADLVSGNGGIDLTAHGVMPCLH